MSLELIIREKEEKVFVVSLQGQIDTQSHQLLEDRLKEVIAKAAAVVLEMGKVDYISSMGLSAVFRIKIALEERKATLALVGLQPQVQKVFEAMKILSPQIFASMQEADDLLDKFLDGVQKGTINPRSSEQ
jgi:anti-anti-sigma factor